MLLDPLRRCASEGCCASVYTNLEAPEKFHFGRVLCCSEEHFVLEAYAADGTPDGWLLKETASVFRLELDSQYEHKMQRLLGRQQVALALDAQHLPLSLLAQAKASGFLVTVEVLGSGGGVTGWVAQAEETCCKLSQVNEYGAPDGCSYIDPAVITQIACHGGEELLLERLALAMP